MHRSATCHLVDRVLNCYYFQNVSLPLGLPLPEYAIWWQTPCYKLQGTMLRLQLSRDLVGFLVGFLGGFFLTLN